MKWIVLLLSAVSLMAIACHAQTKDVPDDARYETQRRGHMVEETGVVRNSLVAAALAPPADDSCKWHVILITKKGDPACDRMREVIHGHKSMKAWIDVANPMTSTMHFQERDIADPLQQPWLKPLLPAVQKFGLPMLIIQPPLNGRFGPSDTVVKMITGELSGSALDDKFRESIIAYVQSIESPGPVGQQVGVAPPFDRNPAPPPVQPPINPLPFEFPPAAPKELTIDQVQAACPGAPPEFVIDVITSKETNIELVKLRWLVYQKDHAKPAEPELIPEPEPVPSHEPEFSAPHPLEPAVHEPSVDLLVTVALVALAIGIIGTKVGQYLWRESADIRAAIRQVKANRSIAVKSEPSTVEQNPKPAVTAQTLFGSNVSAPNKSG